MNSEQSPMPWCRDSSFPARRTRPESWERLGVQTTHPFRISRSVRTSETVVWLRLELDGIEAWGEANQDKTREITKNYPSMREITGEYLVRAINIK